MSEEINLVFLGGFPYPKGMAGTKLIQNIIDGLKVYPDVSIRVVILRQSSNDNVLSGIKEGIPYETIMGDVLRAKMVFMVPVFHMRARQAIGRTFRSDKKNILYVYGPPAFDNMPAIRHARRIGYKVIFEIVEDYNLAYDIHKNLWHRIQNVYIRHATSQIASLADGIVVISSHLETKFRALTKWMIPIHYQSVSVNMALYPYTPHRFGDTITMFYSGSFGFKDGVPILIDAFDKLAAKYGNIRLVLIGKGSIEDMHVINTRIASSCYRERIEYKGYLDNIEYHAALNAADILCMTRINHPYANAGFPFKLGEYLATGKPVVASKVSDVADLLQNGESAMLVEPNNAIDIMRMVEYLLKNPNKATAIGRSGHEVARRHFCHKMQAEALYDFTKTI